MPTYDFNVPDNVFHDKHNELIKCPHCNGSGSCPHNVSYGCACRTVHREKYKQEHYKIECRICQGYGYIRVSDVPYKEKGGSHANCNKPRRNSL